MREHAEFTASGGPLHEILENAVLLVEQHAPGMLCSILLLDSTVGTLHTGAAPSLPAEYMRHFEGAHIGPNEGSCGAAAYTGTTVAVEDILTHPNWTKYRELAAPHGLRACWSTPIFSVDRKVLGTFAMYYQEPRLPSSVERDWVLAATHIAGLALAQEQERRAATLSRDPAERLARLYSVSSVVNACIARVTDLRTLYQDACRIPVQQGLARLAWLGIYTSAGGLDVVAHSGEPSDQLARVARELAERGQSHRQPPKADAFQAGRPTIINDIANEDHSLGG